MNQKALIISSSVLLLIVLFSAVALAQPNFGYWFKGDVLVNGNPAPNGLLITARIDGDDVAGTTSLDGQYGYESALLIYDPNTNIAGETVEFFVNDVKGGETTLVNEGQSTDLDLYVEIHPFCGDTVCESGEDCSSCPQDCGECESPPGDGGNPPGGPGPYTQPPCEENWACSDWFDCFNGRQSRVCTDINQCGTNETKPIEVQDCTVPHSVSPDECNVGETICEGSNVMSCSPAGEFVMVEACSFGCADGACNSPPEGYNETETITPSNPIGDFFNWLFGGSVTGAVTGEDSGSSVWYLFGAMMVVMVVIILGVAWKLRK